MSRGAAAAAASAVQCGQQLKTGTHTLSSHVFVSGERKDSESVSDADYRLAVEEASKPATRLH